VNRGAAFRGQPLLLLAALLLGWMALRVALWGPPFDPSGAALRVEAAAGNVTRAAIRAGVPAGSGLPEAGLHVDGPAAVPAVLEPVLPALLDPIASPGLEEAHVPRAEPVVAPPPGVAPRAAIGHNLLFLAGLSQMEVPPVLLAYLQDAAQPQPGIPAAAPALAAAMPRPAAMDSRWSADGWVMLRKDTTSPILTGRPSYGRSQAGAIVRYRLASESALRPQAYVRVSTALSGAREGEVAAGVSARPLGGVPLRLAVEARIDETALGTRLRPAVYAVTELSPLALPLGVRAEAYGQAGYVGGEFATAFADGQARAERSVGRAGDTEFSAGAGVWGGAQKGAARLDIGPTAAVSFRLGDARGRVAADYRFRVAGVTEPSSGPALTLSAGF